MSIDRVNLNPNTYDTNVKSKKSNISSSSSSDFSHILKSVSPDQTTDLDTIFEKAAATYQVPVNLLKAVAKAESNFNPKATSSCGAQGIMQLMPATARGLGVTDAYDAEQNIMGGAKYLSGLLNRFDGDTKLAVAAYNAGPNAVAKYNGVPPYKETQNYVKKVLGYCGESVTAGTITAQPSSDLSAVTDMETVFQSLGLFGGLPSNSLDESGYALMMNVYQYQLQAKLLAATELNDK